MRVAEARQRRTRQAGGKQGVVRGADGAAVLSPMHGVVLRVAVEPGQSVQAGDLLMIVEAMKMENEITAHRAGVVASLAAAAGATVEVGAVLATIE